MSKKPETEAQPVEAEQDAQEPQNYADMTEEQLRSMIDSPQPEIPVVPVAASDPEEDPEPEPVEAAAEEDPEPAGTEQVEPEPDAEDRLSSLERMVQEADLRRQAEAARNEQLRFQLDRKAGEIAHIKNQLRQPAARATDDYQPDPGEYRQDAIEPVLQDARSEISELRAERVKTVAMQELQQQQAENAQFWNSVAGNGERDDFEKSFNTRLGTELKDMGLEDAAALGDAKRTGVIVRAAYKAALAETRLEWLNRAQEKRRTAPPPSEESRNRKLSASAGAKTSRPTVAPRPKPLEEWTADEIKAEIDRREATGLRVD